MILEIILLALIPILVYIVYRAIVGIYGNIEHDCAMIYKGRFIKFPEIDKLKEDVANGVVESEYYRAHYWGAKCGETMRNFPTIDDPVIKKLFNILSNRMYDLEPIERANFLLAFVQQNVRYVSDPNSTGLSDDWKFPIDTLVDGYGDCEDMAFLLAALYYHDKLDCITVWVTRHMTVGVYVPGYTGKHPILYNDKLYAQAEATGTMGVGKSNKMYDSLYYREPPMLPTDAFKKYITKEVKH